MAQAGDAGPTLLDALVGEAIGGELTQVFWEGWAAGSWSDEHLKSFHEFFATLDPWDDMIGRIRSERAHMVARLSSQGWRALSSNSSFLTRGFSYLLPRGWISQTAAAASRSFDEILGQYDATAHRIRLVAERPEKEKTAIMLPYDFLARLIAPHLDRVFRAAAEQAPFSDLGAMVASLELFRGENGHYPATLDELTPRFLAAVPRSVITGMRPDYMRVDAGHFRLSSAGWSEGAKPPAWIWRAPVATND
jgi:hypothetical protein